MSATEWAKSEEGQRRQVGIFDLGVEPAAPHLSFEAWVNTERGQWSIVPARCGFRSAEAAKAWIEGEVRALAAKMLADLGETTE